MAVDEDEDPDHGLGAADPETDALIQQWAEATAGATAEPRHNWAGPITIVVMLLVGGIGLFAAWALIATADDGQDDPSTSIGDDASVLDSDSPSLEDLTSDVTVPPGPDGGLDVAAQGLSIVPDRFDPDGREGTFAVVLANPHERWLAQGVQVGVTFLDDAGTAVGTDDGFAEVVLPGQQVAVASLLFDAPAEAVADMEVTVDVARWRETGPLDGAFTITDVATGEAEFSGVRTTFTITSGFAEPLADVSITAVYRDADGRVLGGYDTFVDRLDPGVPTPGEISLLANVDPAAVATTELYPSATLGSVPDG